MKQQLKQINLIIFILFFISGCGVKQKVNSLSDKALTPYEKVSYSAQSTWGDSVHYLQSKYNSFGASIAQMKSSFLENEYVSMVVPDEIILENRQAFVAWQEASGYSAKRIVKHRLAKSHIDLEYSTLSTSKKLALINDYFFEKEKRKYQKEFQDKHSRPTFDKFLSDRENIQKINQYKLALQESSRKWELQVNETRKEVATKAIATLYKEPLIKNIRYNPNSQKLYMEIQSQRNDFEKEVFIHLDASLARKFEQQARTIDPTVYFTFYDDNLQFVGVSIRFEDKNYIAKVSDKKFVRRSSISLSTNDNTNLDLSTLDVNYVSVQANITPPKWFNTLESHGIIGYGIGETTKSAKDFALAEIAQTLEVSVTSHTSFEKSMHGDIVSSKKKSSIKTATKKKSLQGVKTLKTEKKDGMWYIAVEYIPQ